MNEIIGTCSLCGGDVMAIRSGEMAGGVLYLTPTKPWCSVCGATKKFPVIEMEPKVDDNCYGPPTVTNAEAAQHGITGE